MPLLVKKKLGFQGQKKWPQKFHIMCRNPGPPPSPYLGSIPKKYHFLRLPLSCALTTMMPRAVRDDRWRRWGQYAALIIIIIIIHGTIQRSWWQWCWQCLCFEGVEKVCWRAGIIFIGAIHTFWSHRDLPSPNIQRYLQMLSDIHPYGPCVGIKEVPSHI